MRWNTRFASRILFPCCLLALAPAFGGAPVPEAKPGASVGMSFVKGDSRNGSKVDLSIVGDSVFYRKILYRPGTEPVESRSAMFLNDHRRRVLRNVMAELPRYPAFGTCFGRDMRFYMLETPEGRFYRSLPERSAKCYADEPGIWSMFQDLDDLMAPPSGPDFQEPSAS